MYFAGIFAYIIVRGASGISSTGVDGRDSMLAGFGVGIMGYCIARLLPVKKAIQNLIPVTMIILGIFHFNDWYLNYQEDWYHQLEFAMAIEKNDGLRGDDTILCDFSDASPNGSTRFYSLNGMSYIVTGKMDKFFYNGVGGNYDLEFREQYLNGYNCNDYDFLDRKIDGVMFIDNPPVSNMQLLRMRYSEILNPDIFDAEIGKLTDIRYIRIDEAVSAKIYETYGKGELDSESLREIVSVGISSAGGQKYKNTL